MDKYKTTNVGGLPLTLNDIRWLLGRLSGSQGIYQALNNLLRGFGDNLIIQGVVASGTSPNVAITEGWVLLDGELLKVDAQTGINTTTNNKLIKQTSFDSRGNKEFQNGLTDDTYEKNRAVVQGASGNLAYNADNLGDIIGLNAFINIDIEASGTVKQNDATAGTGSNTALTQGPQAGSYFRYKIVGKTVYCSFRINNIQTTTFAVTGAASIIIDTLPFTFKTGIIQRGICDCICLSHALGLSGAHKMEFNAGATKIAFQLDVPQGSIGFWNRQYTLDTAPSKNVIAIADTSTQMRWEISGNFIAEID